MLRYLKTAAAAAPASAVAAAPPSKTSAPAPVKDVIEIDLASPVKASALAATDATKTTKSTPALSVPTNRITVPAKSATAPTPVLARKRDIKQIEQAGTDDTTDSTSVTSDNRKRVRHDTPDLSIHSVIDRSMPYHDTAHSFFLSFSQPPPYDTQQQQLLRLLQQVIQHHSETSHTQTVTKIVTVAQPPTPVPLPVAGPSAFDESLVLSSVPDCQFQVPRGKFSLSFTADSLVIHNTNQTHLSVILIPSLLRVLCITDSNKKDTLLVIGLAPSSAMKVGKSAYTNVLLKCDSGDTKDLLLARFKASNVQIITESSLVFSPSSDTTCHYVTCNAKTVNDGLLYPMVTGLLFIRKPVMFIDILSIDSIDILKASDNRRTFDLIVNFKDSVSGKVVSEVFSYIGVCELSAISFYVQYVRKYQKRFAGDNAKRSIAAQPSSSAPPASTANSGNDTDENGSGGESDSEADSDFDPDGSDDDSAASAASSDSDDSQFESDMDNEVSVNDSDSDDERRITRSRFTARQRQTNGVKKLKTAAKSRSRAPTSDSNSCSGDVTDDEDTAPAPVTGPVESQRQREVMVID